MAITFPVFTSWAQHVIDVALLTGQLSTVFGWTIRITAASRPTTLRNYPMQANGAEMLRMACCLATERGINVCAPVHDALLVEGAAGEISDVVAAVRAAMAEASRLADPASRYQPTSKLSDSLTATPIRAALSCGIASTSCYKTAGHVRYGISKEET